MRSLLDSYQAYTIFAGEEIHAVRVFVAEIQSVVRIGPSQEQHTFPFNNSRSIYLAIRRQIFEDGNIYVLLGYVCQESWGW